MGKYILEIIVFICGAVVMALELTGSRILAPFFGGSLIVWTSIIGVILGSLSLGYFLGGKLADKLADYKTLSAIIFASAVAVFLIAPLKSGVLAFAAGLADIKTGTIISTLLLFSPASVLLGMVSPYAAKLKIKNLDNAGATVGVLYAISTIGSIAGTFFAGFYLIPLLGNAKIIILLSLVLIAVSGLAFLKKWLILKVVAFILIGSFAFVNGFSGLPYPAVVADEDSQYNRLIVYDSVDRKTGRPIRNLITDPYGTQSAIFLDADDGLVFEYAKYYFLAEHFNPGFNDSLLIGGGAYSFAKEYLRRYDLAEIDVVEIDPAFTRLARQYFNLKDDPRLKIYEEDGRIFLNRIQKKYDVIYMDAFGSALSIPHHLTTAETVGRLYEILDENGVVLSNIISAIEGDKGKFLRAEYWTYKKYFSHVYVFLTETKDRGDLAQNLMLVAVKANKPPPLSSQNQELNNYLKNNWDKKIPFDIPILTDDHAPVDQYVLEFIK